MTNDLLVILSVLVPGLPLLGFLLNGFLAGRLPEKLSGWISSLLVLGAFAISLIFFLDSSAESRDIHIADWFRVGTWNIRFGFLVDHLTILMMLIITGVGFLIHLYSIGYMHGDQNFQRFFAYLNLFVFFMLLLVMGNSYFMMFIGWEGVGACSYLLIGFWFKNTDYNLAAKKAFVMNRIGDVGFVLAMFFIIAMTGSLEFGHVNRFLHDYGHTADIGMLTVVTLLLFLAATGKSAQIPLYTWLPDAMAGPTPVSALIHAATMVTAGIYMIIRSSALFLMTPVTMEVILWIGTATCVLAAIIGIKQNDIKKVLAYSTVSQLGLLFAALGVGAFSSAFFHLTTHAFFKALLFLGAGSVIHALGGEQDIRKMGGLRKYIRLTFITFLLGTLAISGIPPFSGFFSKDEILAEVFAHSPVVWAILQASSLITVFYMFRLVFLVFYNDFRGTEETRSHIHESPAVITIPLVILAALAVVAGVLGLPAFTGMTNWMHEYLHPVIAVLPRAEHHAVSHELELILMGVAVAGAVLTIIITRVIYISKKRLPEASEAEMSWTGRLVYNKFYVDEVYSFLIKRPVYHLSVAWYLFIDKALLDGIVRGAGTVSVAIGHALRKSQQGSIGFYIFAMVLGVIVLLMIQWLVK